MRCALLLAFACACGSDGRSTSSADEAPPLTEGREAQVRVERLEKDLAALDERIAGETARSAANDRLTLLRRDRAQLEMQLAQARKAWCLTEPTAAGCT